MTDATLTVVCANCGAKYKLPPTFTAAKAKCKACSASIDVAGQRAAAAAPAAAAPKPGGRRSEPAAARPARGSSARPARGGSGSRTARAGSRRRGGDDGDDGEGGGRRGRRAGGARAGGGNGVMIASLVGIAVILAGGGWFFFLRGDDAPAPNTETTADAGRGGATEKAPAAEQPAADPLAAAKDAARESMKAQIAGVLDQIAAQDAAARTDLEKSMDAALDATFSTAADASGDAEKLQRAAAGSMIASLDESESPAIRDNLDALRAALGVAPAKADDEARPAEAKPEPERQMTMAEVFDPKSLPLLEYPDYIEPALREEIDELCRDLPMGGVRERRAQARLAEIGHPAIVGVINAYREIDFTNPDTSMYAFGMNRFITDAFGAGVVNSEFKQTLAGEPIPPEVADWNGKTVKAWQGFWEKFSDKARWEEWVAERRKASQKN